MMAEQSTNDSSNIGKIQQVEITEELQKSYLDYAMSVIVARALPDVRDGLKPVHRRILFTMHQMGLRPGGPFTKSVKVVGEVMGKYHPHGDMPVYDALVRMAQDFSMRYPVIFPQGNFGSVDGDPPAAMRYTEVKLAPIALELLSDIESETVKMSDNFDATLKEPEVLPARLPNLLLMGADGIAVGMATKIPPHNLREVAQAVIATIKKGKLEAIGANGKVEFTIEQIKLETGGAQKEKKPPITDGEISKLELNFTSDVTIEELVTHVPGPDFPTGGAIYDAKSLVEVYGSGRGKITVRGIAKIEEAKGGRQKIVITEIPYQVNKAQLVMRIAQLARDKKIAGIADLRDESDRTGMSVVIELRRDANAKSVLNNLYKHTSLQTSFPANFVALVDGVPRTLALKQILVEYVGHRQRVIVARTIFDLRAARKRAHILEGLKIALDNLDAVIETIRRAQDADDAREKLMTRFKLSEIQATAILDMQLRRLARLEREKIEAEYKEILGKVAELEAILKSPEKILEIITEEIKKLVGEYGDERRTKIFQAKLGEFREEDLVAKEDCLITLSRGGYVKRVPLATYRQQGRGGKGIMGMTTKGEDEIVHIAFASTHDQLLVFTNRGRVLSTPVWEIPETSRVARGQAIVNFVGLERDEQVKTILALNKEKSREYLFMATQRGVVKKTPVGDFANIRNKGIIAIKLEKTDQLIWVHPTRGQDDILLVTKLGKAIKFSEKNVRPLGRATMGVRGIRLGKEDDLIGMEVIESDKKPESKKEFWDLLVVTEKGLGKRTPVRLFPRQGRGGAGVKVCTVTSRTGEIKIAMLVTADIAQIVITSRAGQVIKLPVKNIPQLSRVAQGVILMRFGKANDSVAAVTTIPKEQAPLIPKEGGDENGD